MKTLLIRGAITAFLGLAVATLSAQTQSNASTNTTYLETSKFIGKKVRSAQGEEIGTVKDIVLDRNTGCLAYTVVSTSGGGTTRATAGGKMVAVPWGVYSPSSDLNVFTVTVDRERIYNAPVFDYARIDEYSRPDYITNVYSYYGVSPGAAVGVGVSGSTTTGTTTATGASTTTGAAAGAAGRAGASTTSPGLSASPAATAPPPMDRSPSPRATAAASPHRTPAERPRATAEPRTRGEERTTPPSKRTPGERGRSEESSPPSGRGETGSRSENQSSRPEAATGAERESASRESQPEGEQSRAGETTSGETTTGTHHRERTRKHEPSNPSESPGGQD